MEAFSACHSRPRLTRWLLFIAVFFVVELWIAGVFGVARSSSRFLPWAGITISVLCFLGLAAKLSDTSEQIRIDSAGIQLHSHFNRTIPWSEIADVKTWQYRNQRSIILHLRNPDGFAQRPYYRALSKISKFLTGGDAEINLTIMDKSFDEAMSAILLFRPND